MPENNKFEGIYKLGSWVPVLIVQGIVIYCYGMYMGVCYSIILMDRLTLAQFYLKRIIIQNVLKMNQYFWNR